MLRFLFGILKIVVNKIGEAAVVNHRPSDWPKDYNIKTLYWSEGYLEEMAWHNLQEIAIEWALYEFM